MQQTEILMVLLSIPAELLEEIGLREMDVIQMGVSDGKLISRVYWRIFSSYIKMGTK